LEGSTVKINRYAVIPSNENTKHVTQQCMSHVMYVCYKNTHGRKKYQSEQKRKEMGWGKDICQLISITLYFLRKYFKANTKKD
jgi:hypothetical protein